MKLFGLTITRTKKDSRALAAAVPTNTGGGGWLNRVIGEPYPGAWQRNMELRLDDDLLAFSAVYACVSLIAADIAKLRIKLVKQLESGLWVEVTDPKVPFISVLRKPNHFQTRIQFIKQWMATLLLTGNAYILKERDERGVVRAMYVLNSKHVVVKVAPDGSIYYAVGRNPLAGVDREEGTTFLASEIHHDRMFTPYHPLIGVSPIYACGMSTAQGRKIQEQSAQFFNNQSRPSGILSAPGEISDSTARRIKAEWEQNFSQGNLGRFAVVGDGLKYEAMTIPAADAQLIEQLKWTVEDVGRCFHVPLHMLGVQGSNPSYNNIGALNQAYYSQTLQDPIESVEALLDEGNGLLAAGYGAEFDMEALTRMDPMARAELHAKEIGAGYGKPNEARLSENRAPVAGGDSCYMQQQNYSLAALAQRDAAGPPPNAIAGPQEPPPTAPSNADDDAAQDAELDEVALGLTQELIRKFTEAPLHA